MTKLIPELVFGKRRKRKRKKLEATTMSTARVATNTPFAHFSGSVA